MATAALDKKARCCTATSTTAISTARRKSGSLVDQCLLQLADAGLTEIFLDQAEQRG